MAQDASLAGLRNQILTSIFGRRLGFDPLEFAAGPKGLRMPIFTVTSASTGNTTLPNYGVILGKTTDSSGTTAGWQLDNPQPGCRVHLIQQTSGYGVFTLNGTTQSATAVRGFVSPGSITSGMTTATLVTLWNQGAAATLIGLTTATWAIFLHGGSGSSITTYGSSAS